MPFKKGQIANPEGGRARERRRPITQMYIQLLASDPDKLRKFCKAQIDKAIEGDTVAAKDIIDRIEGKALTTIDVNDQRTSDGAGRLAELFSAAVEANRGEPSTRRTQ